MKSRIKTAATLAAVGGLLAMVLRTELLNSGKLLVSAEGFDRLFTFHGRKAPSALLVSHNANIAGPPRALMGLSGQPSYRFGALYRFGAPIIFGGP